MKRSSHIHEATHVLSQPTRTDRYLAPIREKPNFFRLMALVFTVYAFVMANLLNAEWGEPESSHGPIIFLLAIWLLYRRWDERNVAPELSVWRTVGVVALFGFAAVLFVLGVVGQISQLSYGSIIPFLLSGVLLFQNTGSRFRLLFPVLFVFFSIPLPGFIVDPLTLPMKLLVSDVTEHLLSVTGYPIARSGVILYLGPYQMQVADACAGLRTLFMLEALGLLYLNLVEHSSIIRNIGLTMLVVPISFISNIVRVTLLCLITYHYGDEAGQGFLHEFAGIALFVVALLLLLASDAGLRRVSHGHPTEANVS
jgi:exosortase B